MRRCSVFAAIAALLIGSVVDIPAQSAPPPLLLIFDASGSMNEYPQGVLKISQAKEVVRDLLREFPADVPLGLMVFGHRRAHDCSDIEVVEQIGTSDRARLTRMASWIMALNAKGETPIAQALLDAIPLFKGKPGRIVMMTDGGEDCSGDVCAAADKLAQSGIALKVDIVGFSLKSAQKDALSCITQRTGGRYYDARDAATLRSAFNSATNEAMGRARLEATVTEGAGIKAVSPVVRVRDTSGTEVALTENPAVFHLPAGTYSVTARVGTGSDSAPLKITLAVGETRSVTIGSGTGTLAVGVTKGAGLPFRQRTMVELRREGEANPVAGTTDQPARFQAEAGTYLVRVGLSGNQTRDFPGLRIVAGETSSTTLEVPAGEIEVNVSGGKYAPRANPFPYVEVRQSGRMVTALSDNPARFQLLAGKYTISVTENGNPVAGREVDVAPGAEQSVALSVP